MKIVYSRSGIRIRFGTLGIALAIFAATASALADIIYVSNAETGQSRINTYLTWSSARVAGSEEKQKGDILGRIVL